MRSYLSIFSVFEVIRCGGRHPNNFSLYALGTFWMNRLCGRKILHAGSNLKND